MYHDSFIFRHSSLVTYHSSSLVDAGCAMCSVSWFYVLLGCLLWFLFEYCFASAQKCHYQSVLYHSIVSGVVWALAPKEKFSNSVAAAHPIRTRTTFSYAGSREHATGVAGVQFLPWMDCAVPAYYLPTIEARRAAGASTLALNETNHIGQHVPR